MTEDNKLDFQCGEQPLKQLLRSERIPFLKERISCGISTKLILKLVSMVLKGSFISDS